MAGDQAKRRKTLTPRSIADKATPIVDESDLAAAIGALREIDPLIVGHMLDVCGMPPLRRREAGLEGLLGIVVSQQVSTASARAIFTRFAARFDEFDPAAIVAADDEALRACGLSAPKMRTIRAVCAAVVDGLDLSALAALPPQEAHERLVAIKGIGPWTADIFLLFCLGHPDIMPVGDLALQEAARLALGLRIRPDQKKLERIARRWRPWRGAAARLLWAYYAAVKLRVAVPASVAR